MNDSQNPARPIAMLILLITVLASGFATILTALGNSQAGVMVCGGAMVLNLIVLLLGAFVVASNRRDDSQK